MGSDSGTDRRSRSSAESLRSDLSRKRFEHLAVGDRQCLKRMLFVSELVYGHACPMSNRPPRRDT